MTSPLCYSARLLQPFVRYLQRDPQFTPELLAPLADVDPDSRLPIELVHELLAGALFMTGDPDLGLKAAREIMPGEYGAVEYAARSAATWREACETIGRFMHLLNDALQFSMRIEGERVFIELDSRVELPRAPADFQSAAFHISGSFVWPVDFQPDYEVWFSHPAPENVREYELTFVGAKLRFGAPYNGFVCPAAYLEMRPRSADPQLHVLISKQAESLLAELPRASSLADRVRDRLVQGLAGGSPMLRDIARSLAMSERTLSRRLEEEGTSFKELLEDLRHRMAMRYVRQSELSFSEIAFLLGFSQVSAFHRAFRRWTGQTPNEYRTQATSLGA